MAQTRRSFVRFQSSVVRSHRGIARSLDARGVATARGGAWTAVQVAAILHRAGRHFANGRAIKQQQTTNKRLTEQFSIRWVKVTPDSRARENSIPDFAIQKNWGSSPSSEPTVLMAYKRIQIVATVRNSATKSRRKQRCARRFLFPKSPKIQNRAAVAGPTKRNRSAGL
jgi:hypothetical protein